MKKEEGLSALCEGTFDIDGIFLNADEIPIERGHEASEKIQHRQRIRIDRSVNVRKSRVDFGKSVFSSLGVFHGDEIFVFRNSKFEWENAFDVVRGFDIVDFREDFFNDGRIEIVSGNDGFGSRNGDEVAFDHRLEKREPLVLFETGDELFFILFETKGFGDFGLLFGFAFLLALLLRFGGGFYGNLFNFVFGHGKLDNGRMISKNASDSTA